MNQTEFSELILGLATAASMIPSIDIGAAEMAADHIVKQAKKARDSDPKALADGDLGRFEALGELLKCGARFKEAAERLEALGPVQGEIVAARVRRGPSKSPSEVPEGFEETISPPGDFKPRRG